VYLLRTYMTARAVPSASVQREPTMWIHALTTYRNGRFVHYNTAEEADRLLGEPGRLE